MSRTLTPVAEALEYLLGRITPCAGTTVVDIAEALHLVLADDQTAAIDVPAYDNSAMDGYVVNTSDFDRDHVVLPRSQIIAAGHPGTVLQPGTVARIFTGAPIPPGGNAVVMQENTNLTEDKVVFHETPVAGQNIRLRGHDLRSGETVLRAGHRLQAQDLGLLASLGTARIAVKRPLAVAILNTGDEVVKPGALLAPGQLYDSNSFTLAALLENLGMRVIRPGIVGDSLPATVAALESAAAGADCLISTGGVSVGDADHVRAAVAELGEISLWKLAIKPGKPFAFGQVSGKPFFGLPGNPVAVFVTFLLLVRPALLRLQGANPDRIHSFPVAAGFSVKEPGSRQEYLRVRLHKRQGSLQEAEAFADQGSSLMSSLAWADGLVVIPAHTTVTPGQQLEYLPFYALM